MKQKLMDEIAEKVLALNDRMRIELEQKMRDLTMFRPHPAQKRFFETDKRYTVYPWKHPA